MPFLRLTTQSADAVLALCAGLQLCPVVLDTQIRNRLKSKPTLNPLNSEYTGLLMKTTANEFFPLIFFSINWYCKSQKDKFNCFL